MFFLFLSFYSMFFHVLSFCFIIFFFSFSFSFSFFLFLLFFSSFSFFSFVFAFFLFLFLFVGGSKSDFFGSLNFVTISLEISYKKFNFSARLGD